MKKVVRIILLTVNIITFALVLIYGASGIIQTLFGAGVYEKMLVKIGIPWDYNQLWIFMYSCLLILIVTYILRKKFFE